MPAFGATPQCGAAGLLVNWVVTSRQAIKNSGKALIALRNKVFQRFSRMSFNQSDMTLG
jgi:hypothetical protein